jgi:ParB family chromosome partitioning protein
MMPGSEDDRHSGFSTGIDDAGSEASVSASADVTHSADGQQWLSVAMIAANPYQPRKHFDEAEIADLCDSIRTHGFLQPIVVRRAESGYQIIAGERRLRAAQMASWERVPVQIREVADRQMAELAIVENVQRKDLNAIEKAASFKRYIQEYNSTQEELAARVNIDRSTVSNLMRLLELPEEVKEMVVRGEISAGHAKALLTLGEEHEQVEFAHRVQKESLSVRAVEQAVSEHVRRTDLEPLSIVDAEGNSRPAPIQPGQHIRELEEQLSLSLGTRVEIKQTAKGKGRITVHFASHEEFERLQNLLSHSTPLQTGTM